ncbi:Cu(I)-responsive transcriptional regulator [Isoalcanivorax indicus]|uniref:Cu(I)-responsive transcriptional regulator n=1 Tax=Isoalcanivorax indicus TaxID=2202653 RepID=UPI000DB9932A|nr:Cu(I)-responsive transcriptional regulator [Isoalcanivorax indicus]
MNIGEAAHASGVSARMIRYYEKAGLIDAPPRTESGYRHYRAQDVHMLRFIARGRALGFSMEQLRTLTDLWRNDQRSSADVKALAQSHVRDLTRRIADLQAMVDTLSTLAHQCHGDERPDCPILDALESDTQSGQK